MTKGRIQTSIRLSEPLHQRLRNRLKSRRLNMNRVMEGLVQAWLDNEAMLGNAGSVQVVERDEPFVGDPTSWSTIDLLKAYLRWIPAAIIVKELHGRLVCANENFCELVERTDVIGLLAKEFVDVGTAEVITRHDALVREAHRPFLCAEHFLIRGRDRRLVTVRFPIVFDNIPQLTGALSFDVDEVIRKIHAMPPSGQGLMRICKLPSDRDRTIELSDALSSHSLLMAFIESIPAVATVKDSTGRLLCVNREYSAVTGKNKREVRGRVPVQNWPEDVAQRIAVHDQFVRETQSPILSIDTIPIPTHGTTDRLNIRFPIFNANKELVLTGSFGFDYRVMLQALQLFEQLSTPPSGATIAL